MTMYGKAIENITRAILVRSWSSAQQQQQWQQPIRADCKEGLVSDEGGGKNTDITLALQIKSLGQH